jgi:Secretion system C-terminal sorting domain
MKKNFTIIAFLSLLVSLTAQDNRRNFAMKFAFAHSDTLRKVLPAASIVNTGALVYNSVTKELWMASGHNDTIIRMNTAGQYLGALKIDGFSYGNTTRYIRQMTMKDNYVWLVNNSDTVRKLDPVTGQIVQRIVVPKWAGLLQQITYDSISKGFWVYSNVYISAPPAGYKYRLMDTTLMNVRDSINLSDPIAPENVAFNGSTGGIQNVLFDGVTAGGPYLWFLCWRHVEFPLLGAGGSLYTPGYPATLTQFSLATRKRTGVQKTIADDFDLQQNINQAPRGAVLARLPGITNPVFIIQVGKFITGSSQLLTNDLSGVTVGYEVNTPWFPDAAVDSVQLMPNFSMIPKAWARPLTVSAKVRNVIANQNAAGTVRFDTRSEAGALINTQSVPFSQTPWTYAFYQATATVSGLQMGINTIKANLLHPNDYVLRNDTMSAYVQLTDTTLARDHIDFYPMNRNQKVCFCDGPTTVYINKPEMGTSYKLDVPVTVKSITARMIPQKTGDTTRVRIHFINAQGKPVLMGQSALYQINAVDSASTYMTLQLLSPVQVPANQEFLVTVTEGSFTGAPQIMVSTKGADLSKIYVYAAVALGGWQRADTSSALAYTFNNAPLNPPRALGIRPNFLIRTAAEDVSGVSQWNIAPNPTDGLVRLDIDLATEAAVQLRVYNLNGQLVHTAAYEKAKHFEPTLDLSPLANGMYILSLTTPQGTVNKKVVKE